MLNLLCLVYQNAEFELHANQTQLDHMNNKGVQLLEELKKVPNFNPRIMEQDLDDINLNWETANKVKKNAFQSIQELTLSAMISHYCKVLDKCSTYITS